MNLILGGLAVLSSCLALWQYAAARRFPLHQRAPDAGFAPAVSLLKPLKGCDATTAESLESWFRQDYHGPVEILFGVSDPADPAAAIVRGLILKYPDVSAGLQVCDPARATNAKAAKLAQLAGRARHEFILISDADVRVPADFLANVVAGLRNEDVGLVNCFYRLANPANLAMRCEALSINVDFWSQVLQSRSLGPLDFALGAAILLRRSSLEQIGGFAALTNCLADDYQLGNRIFQQGRQIELCPVVVECWDAPMSWRQVWRHQVRWARTIRVCQPLPYFFSILANATLWPGLWLAAGVIQGGSWWPPGAAVALLAVRLTLAQKLQTAFTPGRRWWMDAWLVPVKDLLQTAVWFTAFVGNTVEWRGRKMRLLRDGTLMGPGQTA